MTQITPAKAPSRSPKLEGPSEPDDGELDQNEPETANKEEAAELGERLAAPIEIGRKPGEKDEGRRAEMRDPAGEKQRRLRHVARIETAFAEEAPRVVERHQRHHQPAQDVDGLDAAAARTGLGGRH